MARSDRFEPWADRASRRCALVLSWTVLALTLLIARPASAASSQPVVTLSTSPVSYTENAAATLLDTSATVSDSDSSDFNGGRLTVDYSANGAAEDRLTIRNQGTGSGQIGLSGGNVTFQGSTIGTFTGGTGTNALVVTFTTANATVAAAQALVQNIQYANVSDNPSTAARTVRFVVDDGDGATSSAATLTVNITAVNDVPTVAMTSGSLAYVENQAATAIDPGLTTNDVESANFVGATVTLTTNFSTSQDALSFTDQNGITGSYSASAGVLTLSGTATLATYQAALRTVAYSNSSDSPSTSTRTVSFSVDDGGSTNNLGTGTRTITVTAANDAPVVTASSGSLAYVENQSASQLDSAIALTDVDGNISGATVAITANFAVGQDVLSGGTATGTTGSYNAGTGVLTITGTTTPANYQAALRTVSYSNSNNDPSTQTRTVTITVADSGTATATATRTITVTPVNDAPTLTMSAGSLAYVENQGPTAIDAGLSTADVDGTTLDGATVAITGNFSSPDALSFTDQGGITGSYNAAAGVLTLTGTASLAAYQAALRTVAYSSSSDSPSTSTRTVTFTADDGGAASNLGSATRTITVTAANDAPVVTATSGALGYSENQGATAIDTGLAATDVDSANFTGATVAITSNFTVGQDVLSFVNQSGITGNYNAGTGVLTLSGPTTVANYQTALRTVAYSNSNENPSTSTRTVTFTANDGAAANNLGAATRSITVSAVNDAPVVTTTAGSLGYAENQAAAAVDAGLTLSDGDSTSLVGATVSISANFAAGQDVLAFVDQNGISGNYDAASGVLSLTGTATVATYQAALRTVAYSNSSESPSTSTRTVTFAVNDGAAANNLGAASRNVAITAVNDAPAVTTTAIALSYVENQTATVVDPGLAAVDLDSANLVSATVSISAGFAVGQDVLAFVNQSGINGTFNSGTGVLTLSGSATPAAYEAALRSITYSNTSENPSAAARTVTFAVNDGAAVNNVGSASRTITVTSVNDAPVVTASTSSLAYAENQSATVVDAALTVADIDHAVLVGATVAITSGLAGGEDVLAFVNQGAISGSFDATNGALTLTGSATVAAYQAALRAVAYSNTSDSPSALARTVTFTVNDGAAANAFGAATRTIVVTPVNDAPVVTATSGSLAYVENQQATAVDTGIGLSDVDSATLVGATASITSNFAAGQDVLSFTDQGGVAGSYNAATGVLTLTGDASLGAYEAALATVAYSNSSESPSALTRTVRFTVDDGSAASGQGSATRTITVTPVNDAPVIATTASSLSYVENQAATAIDPGLAASDVDGATFTGATVAISTNFAAGQDVLSSSNQSGISGNYNASTGMLTLTGTATVAAYQAALRTVAYANTSESPSALARTVTFTVNDGAAASNLASAGRTINVSPVNDAPVTTASAGVLVYVENQAATAIDAGFVVSDVDAATFAGATVAITVHFVAGQDRLSFVDQDGIAGSYDTASGVRTLVGGASPAAYQAALRTVAYSNSSDAPSTLPRTVTYTVDDGSAAANFASATRTITVTSVNDAPSFLVGPDVSVAQEMGLQTRTGFAKNISPGPDEAGQTVDFVVTHDRPKLFAVPPAIASDGTLTYVPAPSGSGTALVTVKLHDDGGTADGGVDTSAAQTFTITVTTIAEEIGAYDGLVLAKDGDLSGAEKYGRLFFTLAPKGKVKGKLLLGAQTFPLAGTADNVGVVHFGAAGKTGPTTFTLVRPGRPDLQLSLTFDAGGGSDQLTGALTEGGALYATITADRALYTSKKNPTAPFRNVPPALVGTYTVVLSEPRSDTLDPAAFPHGNGFGTLKVDKKGVATLTGLLADGTKVSCKSSLSKSDRFPIWVPLAKGEGALVGYAQLELTDAGDVTGADILWFRPAGGAGVYPQGWPTGVAMDLVGSTYRLPPKSPPSSVLPGLGPVGGAGNAELHLKDGGLDALGLTKVLDIDPTNRVLVFDAAAQGVSLKFTAATGQFLGSFVHPVSQRKTTFQGVVLQDQKQALGYFIGAEEIGAVTIAPDDAPDGQ